MTALLIIGALILWYYFCKITINTILGYDPKHLLHVWLWSAAWTGIGYWLHSNTIMVLALLIYAPLMTMLWFVASLYHKDNAKAVKRMATRIRKEPHL